MRVIPNMCVICPADYEQARQAVRYAASYEGPVYIRSSRIEVPCIFSNDYKFSFDKAVKLKDGTDVTIIGTGDIFYELVEAVNILDKNGVNAELINMPVIKPFDSDTVIKSAKKTKLVVTVENHSVIGGLGSAVAECLSEHFPVKMLRIGVNNEFGQSGTPKELLKHYKLDAESIAQRVLELKK